MSGSRRKSRYRSGAERQSCRALEALDRDRMRRRQPRRQFRHDGRRPCRADLRLRRFRCHRSAARFLRPQDGARWRHPPRQYRRLSAGAAASALEAVGMPVPAVPWASPDEDALGTPFIVMERMPGRVFLVWEPHSSFSRDPAQLREVWLQAARMLARLHTVDWQSTLPDWEKPRLLREELDLWTPLLRHAPDPKWLAAGTELNSLLAASMPDEHRSASSMAIFSRATFCTWTVRPRS